MVDDSGAHRGFAFLRLSDPHDLQRAKAELDYSYLRPEHQRFKGIPYVSEAEPGEPAEEPLKVRWSLDKATLWVGDLDASVTTDVLRAAFTQFGNVLACRVIRKPEELGFAHQGFGFVEYPKVSMAAKVQKLLADNLFLINGSPRPVRVEFAVDDEMDDMEGASVTGKREPLPPPHFAVPATLEWDFALKWRELALAHQAETARLQELHRQEREIVRIQQFEEYAREHKKFEMLSNPQQAAAELEASMSAEELEAANAAAAAAPRPPKAAAGGKSKAGPSRPAGPPPQPVNAGSMKHPAMAAKRARQQQSQQQHEQSQAKMLDRAARLEKETAEMQLDDDADGSSATKALRV